MCFRADVEPRTPLEADLLLLGMELVTAPTQVWAAAKRAFAGLDREHTAEATKRLPAAERAAAPPERGTVPADEMQQLVADADELEPGDSLSMHLFVMQRKQAVLAQLREEYKRRNQFGNHQESAVDGGDSKNLFRDAFLGWWMSARPRAHLTTLERWCTRGLTRAKRGLRDGCDKLGALKRGLASIAERGLLTASIVDRVKPEQGKVDVSVDVGDMEDADDLLSATFTFTKVENVGKAFTEMQLPAGVGGCLALDFLTRAEQPEKVTRRAIACLEALMTEHVEPELHRVAHYHSWRVYACVNEADLVPVIRIVVCVRPGGSADAVLKQVRAGFPPQTRRPHTHSRPPPTLLPPQLHLGFVFSDVLADVSCDAHCSCSITDIFESKKTNLNAAFNLHASLGCIVARRLLAKIGEEALFAFEESRVRRALDVAERKRAHDQAHKRTLESHGDRMRAAAEREGKSLDEMQVEVGVTGFAIQRTSQTPAEAESAEERLRARLDALWALCRNIASTKAANSEHRFRNLHDLLFDNHYLKGLLPPWLTPDLVMVTGGTARWFRRAMQGLNAEMRKQWKDIVANEKLTKLREDESERVRLEAESKMSSKARRRASFLEEKKRLAAKLTALGIEVETGDFGAEGPEDPVQRARKAAIARFTSKRAALEAYHAVWHACVGVQAVNLFSGPNRFTLSFQGFDIMEVLPEPMDPPKKAGAPEEGEGSESDY